MFTLFEPAQRSGGGERRRPRPEPPTSASLDRDFFQVRAWAIHAEEVDLSATSQGRFVWADLPPIEPERTTILEGGPPRSTCR